MSGTFGYAWTPQDEGLYKITASFAATESYGSSSAETHLAVGPAPTQITTTEQPTVAVPDYTMTIIAAAIAIIIAVAILGLLIFLGPRKR